MSDNTMNIAGEMSAIAASNGIYTLADNALRLSTESLSTAIDNKVTIDNRLCNVIEQTDLSIVKLSASEYYDLVNSGSVVSNVVYVVENDVEDMYGQQIKNLAPGTDLSDAVNLEQLSNALSDVVIPTDLSAFTNSPGYTTNVGTITGITMNGASKGTAGNVDLGTVLTAHQSLSNCLQNNSSYDSINLTATGGIRLASNVRIDNGYGFTVKDDVQDSYTTVNLTGIGVKEQIENESDDQTNIGAAYITMSTLRSIQLPPSELFKSITFTTKTSKTSQTSSLADLVYTKSETSSTSEIANALSDIKISYDSDARKIVLSAGSSTTSVDCNDFIKDGMLSTVELDGKQLVFNFNTDAGMQPISIALSNFIDETQYWKKSETSSAAEIQTALDSYLLLSGGTMSGDITVGKDNQLVFGSNEDGTVVFKDASEADFGIYLSAEEDGEPAYQSKYIFNDTYSGFNVVEPTEEGTEVIRSGDLYAALSSKADYDNIPLSVSQLENDVGYLSAHQSLSGYYTKSETSSAVEISAALDSKADLSAVSQVIVDGVKADISVMHMSKAEYDQTAEQGQLLSNALYIVSGDYVDVIEDTAGNRISANLCCTIAGSQNATKLVTLDDITSKADTSTVTSLSNSLSSFYTKTETSSAAEISSAFQLSAGNKVFIDNHIDNVTEQTDLSVIKLSSDEYYQLVAASAIISNAVYVVENQFKNAYGQQIKNVALPTDLSDAATKGYVDTVVANVQIPTDLSSFTNSPGYTTNVGTITGITMNGASKGTAGNVDLGTVLTAHQSLSDYYTKSETSSASEISNSLSLKADLSGIQQFQNALSGRVYDLTDDSGLVSLVTDLAELFGATVLTTAAKYDTESGQYAIPVGDTGLSAGTYSVKYVDENNNPLSSFSEIKKDVVVL